MREVSGPLAGKGGIIGYIIMRGDIGKLVVRENTRNISADKYNSADRLVLSLASSNSVLHACSSA